MNINNSNNSNSKRGYKRTLISYPYAIVVKSPQIVRDIVASNGSPSTTKPTRSFSTEVTSSTTYAASTTASTSISPTSTHSSHSASSSSAFKLSHPNRKYFDSGDYELARAGILSSASVGSIHPSADKLQHALSSASRSRDEMAVDAHNPTAVICRNLSAPNTATHLQKSTFSMASLDESESEDVDRRMEI